MIHHVLKEKIRVAEIVEEQVGRLGGEGGAAGEAGADGYGKGPDTTPTPYVVLRIADDNDIFAGEATARVGIGTAYGDRWQFGTVGVIAAEGTEREETVQPGGLNLTISGDLVIAGEQSQLHILPASQMIDQGMYAGKHFDVVWGDGPVRNLDVCRQRFGYQRSGVRGREAIIQQDLLHDLRIRLARERDALRCYRAVAQAGEHVLNQTPAQPVRLQNCPVYVEQEEFHGFGGLLRQSHRLCLRLLLCFSVA